MISQFSRARTLIALACVAAVFVPAARGDTIYLKNGSWIDGVATSRDESVLVRIGNVGQVEIPLDEVYAIEKNGLTGSEASVAVQARELQLTEDKQGAGVSEDSKDFDDETEVSESKTKKHSKSRKKSGGNDTDEEGDEEEQIAPDLKAKILVQVEDLTKQNAKFRVRAERQLKMIGAPAIPYLIPAAKNANEFTRIAVMRLFLAFGDDRVVDVCIQLLVDTNEYVRDFSNQALKRVTLQDFGFRPNASPRRRRFAQQKWQKWWTKQLELRQEEEDEDAEESSDDEEDADRDGAKGDDKDDHEYEDDKEEDET